MSENIKNGKAYGCHVDLGPNEEPDGCVVDYGDHADCIYATTKTGGKRRSKWGCPFWKPIKKEEVGE